VCVVCVCVCVSRCSSQGDLFIVISYKYSVISLVVVSYVANNVFEGQLQTSNGGVLYIMNDFPLIYFIINV